MAIQGPKMEAPTPVPILAPGERRAAEAEGRRVLPPAAVVGNAALPKKAAHDEVQEVHAEIARRLEEYVRASGRNLEIRVDDSAQATVITVRRADTGEVIRQFPSEEALALMRRLNEQSGAILDVFA
jgi:uncharacterized FlaG/YvyC family protein